MAEDSKKKDKKKESKKKKEEPKKEEPKKEEPKKEEPKPATPTPAPADTQSTATPAETVASPRKKKGLLSRLSSMFGKKEENSTPHATATTASTTATPAPANEAKPAEPEKPAPPPPPPKTRLIKTEKMNSNALVLPLAFLAEDVTRFTKMDIVKCPCGAYLSSFSEVCH